MNEPRAPHAPGSGGIDAPAPARRSRSVTRTAAALALFLMITATMFFVLEGAASSALFVRNLMQRQDGVVLSEERHTRYDPELGWVSVPNLAISDMYGPGKSLTTNSRGFRGPEVQARVPNGKRRVICSGDSFTLGHGVADDDTWCARLSSLDTSLETVNMGQGGYGIDQAFLWYTRDGAGLERSVHVVAFIGDDFLRVQSNHFLGYGKPVLELESGHVVTRNTPAPRRTRPARWLIQNGALFRELASVRLLSGIVSRLGDPATAAASRANQTWNVAAAIFDSLAAENAAKEARLVLLFLPTPWDYDTQLYDEWRGRVHAYAEDTNTPFVDLVDELRSMTSEEARALFIPTGQIGAPHLNESGNDWVARRLIAAGVLQGSEAVAGRRP